MEKTTEPQKDVCGKGARGSPSKPLRCHSWMQRSRCCEKAPSQQRLLLIERCCAVVITQLLGSNQRMRKTLLFTEAREKKIKPQGSRRVQLFHNNLHLSMTFEQFNISFCNSSHTFFFPHTVFSLMTFLNHSYKSILISLSSGPGTCHTLPHHLKPSCCQ